MVKKIRAAVKRWVADSREKRAGKVAKDAADRATELHVLLLAAGDEPRIEQHDGRSRKGGGLGSPKPRERAPDCGDRDAGDD
jgi:hypothetical protein